MTASQMTRTDGRLRTMAMEKVAQKRKGPRTPNWASKFLTLWMVDEMVSLVKYWSRSVRLNSATVAIITVMRTTNLSLVDFPSPVSLIS